jgi:hypothetical protein
MGRVIVVPADNGIPIGTVILDDTKEKYAYAAPISYDTVGDAIRDYHDAVANGGELPFTLEEGIVVWLLDLDSGCVCSFWDAYRLVNGPWDKSTAPTAVAMEPPWFKALSPSDSLDRLLRISAESPLTSSEKFFLFEPQTPGQNAVQLDYQRLRNEVPITQSSLAMTFAPAVVDSPAVPAKVISTPNNWSQFNSFKRWWRQTNQWLFGQDQSEATSLDNQSDHSSKESSVDN